MRLTDLMLTKLPAFAAPYGVTMYPDGTIQLTLGEYKIVRIGGAQGSTPPAPEQK